MTKPSAGPRAGPGAAGRPQADPFITTREERSGRRRAIPTDIYTLVAEKRSEILALAARYGITNVRVFGSVARHEAGPESDLDLLVTFGPTATLFDLIRFEREVGKLLGWRVEVASDRGLKDRIRDTVLQEAVPL